MMDIRIARWAGTVLVVCVLGAGAVWAADTKEALPQNKKPGETKVEKAPERTPPVKVDKAKQDKFIDKDNNGVDDRRESKVRRPEQTPPSSTIKSSPPPKPADTGASSKPPGFF